MGTGALIATIIMGIIGVIAGTATTAVNHKAQTELLDYQKERDTIQDQRADTTYQRTIQDMQLAGYNPAMLNAQAQGGTLAETTQKSAPQWEKQFQAIESMAQKIYGWNEMQSKINLNNANAGKAKAEENLTSTQNEKGLLELDYLSNIADDRVKKYKAELSDIYATTEGRTINNAIQNDLKGGYKTLQDLEIQAAQIGNKLLNAEKNMTELDWKYAERYGITRNMSPTERQAVWAKVEQAIKNENGIQKLVVNTWHNNAQVSMNMQDSVKMRQNSEMAQNWINTGSNAVGNIMGGTGRFLGGLFMPKRGARIFNDFGNGSNATFGGFHPNFNMNMW